MKTCDGTNILRIAGVKPANNQRSYKDETNNSLKAQYVLDGHEIFYKNFFNFFL